MTTEPSFVIELPVGSLAIHDLTVGTADPGVPVVLAVHGITANGLSFREVAEELHHRHGPGAVRVLAPDLRGRAASRDAPAPYGLAAHVADLTTVVGAFGAQPVVIGHSMGAFVTALAAAAHPGMYRAVVLVDGGLAFPPPPDLDVDAALAAVIGPAMDRLSMRFDDEAAHLEFWQRHPAVGPVLRAGTAGESVRRYLDHDLVPAPDTPGALMSSCILEAVRADGRDVLVSEDAHSAARRAVAAGVPMELVWAHRGLLDEPQGLYDEGRLAALDLPDDLVAHGVDANHYDVILSGEGLTAVADAIDRGLAVEVADRQVDAPSR